MTFFKHPVAVAVLVSVAVALASTRARSEAGHGAFEVLERWALDVRFAARGPQPVSKDLALVVFDDATAEKNGPLFERRAGWAQVLRAVHAEGAKVVGIDAVFAEPERLLSPALGAKVAAWRTAHPEPGDDEPARLLADVAHELDGDGELEAALREAGNTVLILFAGRGDDTGAVDPSLARARYGQSTRADAPLPEAPRISASLPRFNAAAKGLGFATVDEDATRTVRRVALAVSHGDGVYLPFVVAAAASYLGVNRGKVAWLGPQAQLKVGELLVPVDAGGAWLDYRGPARSYPTYSAADVAAGALPAGALDGKLVLIGVTRLGYDVVRTPFGFMPGVEVQATAIDDVLSGRQLRRTSRAFDALVTAGLGVLVALFFASRRVPPALQAGGAGVVAFAWLAGSQLAFARAGTWSPTIGPLLAVLGSALAGLALSYTSEARQRRELKKAFGHYVGEEVLDELLAAPGALSLGGERRRLSVLFSDIRDFTTFSESLPPDRLVQVLNTYLSPMTRAVLDRGGMLDKYIGDAVMAVFGAPLKRDNHAEQALSCALDMHAALEALNAGPLAALGLEFAIGVGINTGEMVVGNMGAETRFDYTVAGDAVNLASRLEGLTKAYGVFCLVGDATRAAAPEAFRFRALDLVQVKGKHEAIPVWELLSGPGREVARYEALDAWDRGLAAWRAGRLPEAREALGAFAKANPKDVAVQQLLERLAALPPEAPEGFSPVTVFTRK